MLVYDASCQSLFVCMVSAEVCAHFEALYFALKVV